MIRYEYFHPAVETFAKIPKIKSFRGLFGKAFAINMYIRTYVIEWKGGRRERRVFGITKTNTST